MKGFRRMIAVATSTIAALALQGCSTAASGAVLDAGVSKPAPASKGIQLAAPAPLGTPEMSVSETAGIAPIHSEILPAPTTLFTAAVPSGQIGGGDDDAAITLSMMPNTADAVLPTKEWSNSEVVALIAARQQAESFLSPASSDQEKDFAAEFTLDAPSEITGFGFDLGVAPRMAYREEGELKSRSFGGELRIGQNFDKRGEEAPNSWYIFAGADGEALTYEPGEEGISLSSGNVALRDQITVGDMQAGVSVQRGPGQLSLSYIRREVSYSERGLRGASENEDFAGVSFTLRR